MRIALRIGGAYVCAEGGGDAFGFVHANRPAIGAWETWTVERQQNGAIALRSINGRYLCAELGGGGAVLANREVVGAWEQFTIAEPLADGGRISLGTVDGRHFVGVRADGDHTVHADTLLPVSFVVEVIEADARPSVPTPGGPLSEVRVSGVDFIDDRGRLVFREATNFMQFYRHRRGEDMAPTLYAGIDLDRTTLTMKYIPEQLGLPVLNPLSDLGAFQRELDSYLAWKRSIRRRSELTVLCDMADMGIGREDQARILDATYEVADRYRDVCLVEFGNEVLDGENRLDLPWLIARVNRRGVISCSGSGTSGAPAPEPYLDYCAPHLVRGGGLKKALADINFGEQVYGSWPEHPTPCLRPMLTNEMIGADEHQNSDSRSTDPNVFRELGRGCRARCGGAFHATDAVYSRALGPKQDECRAAFVEG